MREFGLIGFPLGQSFSRGYFTEKFLRMGISDAQYLNFPISSIEEFPSLLNEHPLLRGINVTMPYKESVIEYLHELDPVVMEIGATNCIRIKDGLLKGFNTDVIGFEKSLMSHLDHSHHQALILGTGGASKAVAYVLKKSGIHYRYVSRSAKNEGLTYQDLTESILSENTLIINTTPVGTFPKTEECPPIPYQFLGPQHHLFDLLYNPEMTLFMRKGESKGAVVQNGFEMLIGQAEAAWEIWNS